MESQVVAALVAAAVSLALEVVPGLRELWDSVDGRKVKPLVVLGLCLGLPLLAVAAACAGVDLRVGAVCPADPAQGIVDALLLGVSAFTASQVAHVFVGQGLGAQRKWKVEDDSAAG